MNPCIINIICASSIRRRETLLVYINLLLSKELLWQSRKVTCHACVCLGYRCCLFLRFWNLILKLCNIFVFHFITKYALTSRPRRQVGEPHSQAHHHYEYYNYRYDNRGGGNFLKRDWIVTGTSIKSGGIKLVLNNSWVVLEHWCKMALL
jgi:hypothetical protein